LQKKVRELEAKVERLERQSGRPPKSR